jgi:hypothetical protein
MAFRNIQNNVRKFLSMPDISKCEGIGCPLRNKCYRYTSIPTPYYQAWSEYYKYLEHTDNGVKCENFMRDERRGTKAAT